jgi:hypothetical protein
MYARCTTAQVIQQVNGELRVRGYGINLRKNMINMYVALVIVGSRHIPSCPGM